MKIIFAESSNTEARGFYEYGAGGRRGDEGVSWNELIMLTIKQDKDDSPTLTTTLTETEFNEKFDDGYGGERGRPFTAWTDKRVYFPVCYDGSEWVGSVPRNPCNEVTVGQGGG